MWRLLILTRMIVVNGLRWFSFAGVVSVLVATVRAGVPEDRNRADRVNVSCEGVDLRLSYDLFKKVARVYGAGGYIIRKEPDDLERLSAQAGVELRSP